MLKLKVALSFRGVNVKDVSSIYAAATPVNKQQVTI